MPVVAQTPKYVCDICGQETAQPISYHLYIASSGHAAIAAFGAEEEQLIACSAAHAQQALLARFVRLEGLRQAKIAAAETSDTPPAPSFASGDQPRGLVP